MTKTIYTDTDAVEVPAQLYKITHEPTRAYLLPDRVGQKEKLILIVFKSTWMVKVESTSRDSSKMAL
jgi:hypothetical protein